MTQETDFGRPFQYRLLDESRNVEAEISLSGDDVAIQWVTSTYPSLVALGILQRETISGWVRIPL